LTRTGNTDFTNLFFAAHFFNTGFHAGHFRKVNAGTQKNARFFVNRAGHFLFKFDFLSSIWLK